MKKSRHIYAEKGEFMGMTGFRKSLPSAFEQRICSLCPFCHKELGKVEMSQRRTVKKCRCNHCGALISDKHMRW